MSETTSALDEAFERMAAASFELPNGFVNHGAMACEALAKLGCTGEIDGWARRFAQVGGAPVEPVAPASFEWQQALGDYDRLPEWIGFFAGAVDEGGWSAVVRTWVPRLMPGLRTALFHGAIRTAHAVRAIDAADTEPRRGELARALGYWAARNQAGQPTGTGEPADDADDADDVRLAVVHDAAQGARHYLARPDIVHLHGVTGAMAVEILAGHIPASAAAAALAQVRAEYAVLYARTQPVAELRPVSPRGSELVQAAVSSLDPHQVKLVEACRRGFAATGDPAFAAAAQTVTGLHLPRWLPGNQRGELGTRAGGLARPEWLNGLEKAEWVSRDRRVHSDRDRSRQGGQRSRGPPGLAGRLGSGGPGRALRRHRPGPGRQHRRAGSASSRSGPGPRWRDTDDELPGGSPVRNGGHGAPHHYP
jgi:hypothetical protein